MLACRKGVEDHDPGRAATWAILSIAAKGYLTMNRSSLPSRSARSPTLSRRGFARNAASLALGSAAWVAARPGRAEGGKPPNYRVAVIGHTGRGNYGHGLDRVWLDVPQTAIVAVADADPQGLARAVRRLDGVQGYGDYRRMLDEVRPDLVAVAPRWLDQHGDMVTAAAERGAKGIYLEKPMCRTPEEADRMAAACQKHGVKLAIAFQTRYSPRLKVIESLIAEGRIGRVIEIRARGKEDRRGGGEDLWVLGSHVLNLTNHFGGAPQSCFARVYAEGKPVTKGDVQPGAEGIGPLAGDEVHAMYRMASGVTACFDSVRGAGGRPTRFGLRVFGSAGLIDMGTGWLPPVHLLEDSSWSPGQSGKSWQPVTSAGVGKPEPLEDTHLHGGNVAAVRDLIDAIENDRPPVAHLEEARTSVEMIAAVFESQRAGGPVDLPLEHRGNPLERL